MDVVKLFMGTFAGKRLYKVWTEDVSSIVSSKIPVVSCLRNKPVILNHVVQTVAFVVRIQSRC